MTRPNMKRVALGLCLTLGFAAIAAPTVLRSLYAVDGPFTGPTAMAEDVHPLQGKPAPAISVDSLGGGKFDLAENRGKVVIIDFWATWCGPCVRGLPIVNGVAKAHAEEGVVFYAMNVQEDAPTIKAFLKKQKLDMKVALDTNGAVSEAYGVQGIPQTVIIGKDGVISKIHVGFGPDMKEQLDADVKAALEAK